MNVKEVEEKSGLPRANIRFYENEGLLHPRRMENGYRDYSEEDVETLKRIRLLRSLHVSLEDIKSLHRGEQELSHVMEVHIETLKREREDLSQSEQVCFQIQKEGVRYESLQPQRYLEAMEQMGGLTAEPIAQDTTPQVRAPWRRYFARAVDLLVYSTLWEVFLLLVVNTPVGGKSVFGQLLDVWISMFWMLILEPLFLSLFGTTLGKWLLGLQILDREEGRLSYKDGFYRTFALIWYGMGAGIPIFNLIRYWKSYKATKEGAGNPWEEESLLLLKDERKWRVLPVVGGYLLCYGCMALAIMGAEMPPNRGELTVREFSENYNHLADHFYGKVIYDRMDTEGKLLTPEESGELTVYFPEMPIPEFQYTEEEGTLTGVSFSVQIQDERLDVIGPYTQEQMLAVLSFVKAREEYRFFSTDLNRFVTQMAEHPFADTSFSGYGVTITCDVETNGYQDFGGMMALADGVRDPYWEMTFTIEENE